MVYYSDRLFLLGTSLIAGYLVFKSRVHIAQHIIHERVPHHTHTLYWISHPSFLPYQYCTTATMVWWANYRVGGERSAARDVASGNIQSSTRIPTIFRFRVSVEFLYCVYQYGIDHSFRRIGEPSIYGDDGATTNHGGIAFARRSLAEKLLGLGVYYCQAHLVHLGQVTNSRLDCSVVTTSLPSRMKPSPEE